MRSVPWLLAVLALGACSKSEDAAPSPTPPMRSPGQAEPTVPADGAACDQAVRHVFDLMKRSGDRDLAKEAEDDETVANALADCKRQAWPPEMLVCAGAAPDLATIDASCNKLAFGGAELDMKPGRTFRADGTQEERDRIAGAVPKMFALDGDFEVFDEATNCGVMKKKRFGVEAMFVICGGRVVVGPLTTIAEISAVMGEMPKASAGAASLASALASRFPPGCPSCRYRVYDASGAPVAP
ncbi:MAG: hypothetical protein KF773_29505 [Deltaproteobacteria bacterium]|nr:hypothetical protein [Deltaproteobacteria bacterium]MCW5807365.1 hypothetical protein [Deltaproteobacteria bacterium]